MECSGTAGVGTLGKKPYQPSEHGASNPPLTVGTRTVATPVVAETGGDRESMATEGNHFNRRAERGVLENSRWNKTDIGAGTAAGTRWVP